ncbi:MAG: hypothetical protein AB7G68_02790 [Nitrospiraceae bacterium]|jgi:hypothetical protein
MKKSATTKSSDAENDGAPRRRMPSRIMKKRLRERLASDTQLVNDGGIVGIFRRQGYYEELPLDELQDRLSKLQSPLAESLLKGRA